jgi:hypothetical protein
MLYGGQVRNEAKLIESASDQYLVHEYLEASPQAVYFRQFVEQLSARGLEYVAEARPGSARVKAMEDLALAHPEWREHAWLDLEQHADYVQGNELRRSVICRAGSLPPSRQPPAEAVERLSARSAALPAVNELNLRSPQALPLRMRDGAVIQIAEPIAKYALAALARAWPGALTFEQLLAALRRDFQLGDGFAVEGSAERAALRQTLNAAYGAALVDLLAHPPATKFVPQATDKPLATPLARLQAREMKPVTNRLHQTVAGLTKVDRLVLAHLNGARDRAALANVLRAAVGRKLLADPAAQPNEAHEAGATGSMEQSVEAALAKLAGNAVLVG